MNPALVELTLMLANLYPDPGEASLVAARTDLQPAQINLSGTPRVFWMRIVQLAENHRKVLELTKVVREDYPNLSTALANIEQRLDGPPEDQLPRNVPRVDAGHWQGPDKVADALEKVIGKQPTFLPISFLEIGLQRARSVARVSSPQGIGTGFLVGNNLLITCNHVIPSADDASRTTIWFNYQTNPGGAQAEVDQYALDPGRNAFATSPAHDWTVVRIKDNARGSANMRWGKIELREVTIKVDEYVNIIQHPGGLPKQIALYHNMVVYADPNDHRVQYLTDTLPGASGSPVFDSEWRVVALHHAGGDLVDPKSGRVFFRNEGIHVNALMAGLKKARLTTE